MKEKHVPKRKPRRIRCANCPCFDPAKMGFGYVLKDGEVLIQLARGACRGRLPETHQVGEFEHAHEGVRWFLLSSGWNHVSRDDWCAMHPDFEGRRKP